MQIRHETVIDGAGQAFVGWAVADGGRPALVAVVDSRRTTIVFDDAEQARSIGCGGIFVAGLIDQQKAPAKPLGAKSPLVGADGLPIFGGG